MTKKIAIFAVLACSCISEAWSQELLWARHDGGSSYDYAYEIVSLPDGGMATAGEYNIGATFGAGENEATLPNLSYGRFLARYGAAGDLLWATPAVAGRPTFELALAAAGDGSLAVSGYISTINGAILSFYGTNGTSQSVILSTYDRRFLAKWDGDGRLLWVRILNMSGGYVANSVGLAGLSDGSYLITGNWRGVLSFGSGSTVLQSAYANGTAISIENTFIARYAASGSLSYAKQVTGRNYGDGQIAALPDDSAIFTGVYVGSPASPWYGARFGSGEAGEVWVNDYPSGQRFIAKVDATGNTIWARTSLGGDPGQAALEAEDLDVDAGGSVSLTGQSRFDLTFGPGQANETKLSSGGIFRAILARYDADGYLRWARHVAHDQSAGTTSGYGVATDGESGSLVTGTYAGTATFGMGTANETVLTNINSFSSYLARYDATGAFDWVTEIKAGAADGSFGRSYAQDVDVSDDGTIDVTGYFLARATLAPGEAQETLLISNGSFDPFTAKYQAPGDEPLALILPADMSAHCDDSEHETATVNFIIEIAGLPPEGSMLVITDNASGTVLDSRTAATGPVGVGPVAVPLGLTIIKVTLTDAAGEALLEGSFEITVEDTTPPVLLGVESKTIECQAEETLLFASLLGISATDECDSHPVISFAPAAVGMGTTSVTVKAQDLSGNASTETFNVTVADTTAPFFVTFPTETIERECTNPDGALVSFTLEAIDACTGVSITCTNQNGIPVDPTGTVFAHGNHTVTCVATDASGNTTEPLAFGVNIIDTTAPVITCPEDITVGNDPGLCTAAVEFAVKATDLCDPDIPIVVTAEGIGSVRSGDVFPLGTTAVTAVATDHEGNEATCTFNVTVLDVEAPQISAPESVDLFTDCAGSILTMTTGDLSISATDNCDETLTLVCNPSTLDPGTKEVTCSVVDAAGNAASVTVSATVWKGPFECTLLRPLDGNVDNRIKAGRTVPVKLRVACDNVFDPGVEAVIASVEHLDGDTVFANEVIDDSGTANDEGFHMRLAGDDEFYIYNLSTKNWDPTPGARFLVTLRVSKAEHVDTLCDFILVNK